VAPEPDLDSLLSKPETLEKLLGHDRAKKEIEHRAKSIREADVERRAEEKANARLQQWQAEQSPRQREIQEQTERQVIGRIKQRFEDDPTDPLAQELSGWATQKSQELQAAETARQAQRQQLDTQRILGEAYGTVGRQVFEALTNKFKIEDADAAALDPRKFPSFMDWFTAAVDTVGERKGKALAKELAKVEAEAIVQQRLGELRGNEPTPATLPNGASARADSDFLAEFAAGKNQDFKRARQLLGR